MGEKAGALTHNGLILSVSDKEINLIDPRAKDWSVRAKAFRDNHRFNRVLGVSGTHFVVGSDIGEVRLYDDFGKRSINTFLPPEIDQIRFMDASKDGLLMLFTFAKYILLLTQRNKHDMFERAFGKNEKPSLEVLEIESWALANAEVRVLNFHSAKFDEKPYEAESYIVGVADDVIVLWNLPKVMNGYIVTSKVKRTDRTIVEGEFRYGADDIITVFTDQLTIHAPPRTSDPNK